MYEQLLVPTDDSPPARRAHEHAADIAREAGGTVHALHVADEKTEDARRIVEAATDRLSGQVTSIEAIRSGTPTESILGYASTEDVDVIVIGTHGRRSARRRILGSVAEAVVRDADRPVIVVSDEEELRLRYPYETILVPTDGSDHARAALLEAVDLAAHTGATLELCSVVERFPFVENAEIEREHARSMTRQLLDAEATVARQRGVEDVGTTVAWGSTHRGIRSTAADVEADLVVVGTHGRSAVERLLLGSVTERVLRTATTPVLTVRADGE